MPGKFNKLVKGLIPPAIAWRLGRAEREKREQEEFAALYKAFVSRGDLCFDVGANLGNRTRSFRSLGCRVVAVEPQSHCLEKLRREYKDDPEVAIIGKALGRTTGSAVIRTSPDHVLSSMSDSFIKQTTQSGRFAGVKWSGEEVVEVTTLDALIAEYGVPSFLKIDVEGHEPEVLAGLSTPVPAVSIEWVPELFENARRCIERLGEIGDYEFNLSWGESMKFSRKDWRSAGSILTVIGEFQEESTLFGDIYARLRPPHPHA
jgi:FkbM family methyltransferase